MFLHPQTTHLSQQRLCSVVQSKCPKWPTTLSTLAGVGGPRATSEVAFIRARSSQTTTESCSSTALTPTRSVRHDGARSKAHNAKIGYAEAEGLKLNILFYKILNPMRRVMQCYFDSLAVCAAGSLLVVFFFFACVDGEANGSVLFFSLFRFCWKEVLLFSLNSSNKQARRTSGSAAQFGKGIFLLVTFFLLIESVVVRI